MKHPDWDTYTDEQREKAVEDAVMELTPDSSTKMDLLNMLCWLYDMFYGEVAHD